MQVFTYHEGIARAADEGIDLTALDTIGKLPSVTFTLPKDSGEKTVLARVLAGTLLAEFPAYVNIDEHGIWPSAENVSLFERYRGNEDKPFDHYPIHRFEHGESDFLEGIVALSLYFIWGIVATTAGTGRVIFRTSHDEWIEVASSDTSALENATKELEDFGLIRWR